MAEPDWGDFRIILALGRGGSVAGAARLLGIDSSTVSRRLGALEESLGAVLVIRGGRDFSLTAEGRAAVAAAEAMEASVSTATAAIRAAKTELEGVVRISAVSPVVALLLPFQELLACRHPDLSVQYVTTNRAVDLARGEADIAIRMTRPTELDVIALPGFELAMAVYAAKSYLTQHGTPKAYEDLRAHKLIQYSAEMLHLPWFSWIEQYADPVRPATRVDTPEVAQGLIGAGAGIGVLNCLFGDTLTDVVRVFPTPIAVIKSWMVIHETARNSSRVKVVRDMLLKFYEARKDAFLGVRRPPGLHVVRST